MAVAEVKIRIGEGWYLIRSSYKLCIVRNGKVRSAVLGLNKQMEK